MCGFVGKKGLKGNISHIVSHLKKILIVLATDSLAWPLLEILCQNMNVSLASDLLSEKLKKSKNKKNRKCQICLTGIKCPCIFISFTFLNGRQFPYDLKLEHCVSKKNRFLNEMIHQVCLNLAIYSTSWLLLWASSSFRSFDVLCPLFFDCM